MGTVITNLKARFGADTSELRKGMKDGAQAVDDFKGAAGNSIGKFAELFGVNMGAVNGALETTRKSLNFLGQSFAATSKGANVLSIAMKVLKVALISTGIGALIVALGSLIAYFKGTGEGADKFRVIMAQLRSVIDNLTDRLQTFGSGLVDIFSGRFKDGVEKIRGAFKGMGQEIKEDWKLSGDLADRENELYRRETELTVSLEERRQKMEELRLAARDITKTEQEQLSAQKQAIELRKSIVNDELSIEKERLAIMQEKLRISASDPTREQLREIADQQAKLNSIQAAGARGLLELTEYYNTLTRKIEAAAAAQKKLAEETEKAWQKMVTTAKPATPQLFDMSKINTELRRVEGAVVTTMSEIDQQLNAVFEDSFETMLGGLGEFLGGLAIGQGGIQAFGKVVAGTFADMAITVGKIAIATGVSVKGIKAALETLNPAVAIVAGAALVALGSMVKGALASAASGSLAGGGGGLTAGGSATFDLSRVAIKQQPVIIRGQVEVVQRGRDLRGVLNIEDNIRKTNS